MNNHVINNHIKQIKSNHKIKNYAETYLILYRKKKYVSYYKLKLN
jgi:hypothetical protein